METWEARLIKLKIKSLMRKFRARINQRQK